MDLLIVYLVVTDLNFIVGLGNVYTVDDGGHRGIVHGY